MTGPYVTSVFASSVAGAPGDAGIYGAKILIADDDALSCRLMAGILQRQDFTRISFADGGVSALELLDSFRPDLVVLDIQMPDLDGLEVCKRIRGRPEFADLPILIQTATFDRSKMGVLFEAGATDFLSKPINPSELVSRITLHLDRWKLLRDLRVYRERTSQELDAARRMQSELLPAVAFQRTITAAAGLRIGSHWRSSSEVGGDFWGILPLDVSSFGVFLADFAGHGVTAALNTFRLHALIHEHKNLHGDPAGLLDKLNERLLGMLSPGQFATFVYVVVDPANDRLRFASAGAPPSIAVAGRGGDAALVEAFGLPLGVVDGTRYQSHEVAFPPGSTLLLFSDGLSEFPDAAGARLGDEGLRTMMQGCGRDGSPDEIIEQICEAVGLGPTDALPDDVTIVCLDRNPAVLAVPYDDCMDCMLTPGSARSRSTERPFPCR